MQIQTGVLPLSVRREEAAIGLYERVKRLGIVYWDDYRPACQRLKTQKCFTFKAEELITRSCLDFKERLHFPKQTTNTYSLYRARGYLHLLHMVRKNETTTLELKAAALETIHTRFPTPPWKHVYTDGSALDARGNAGAGVFTSDFQIAEPVGRFCSNFDGEVKAVL
ncbi:uncharacterized protein [Rhodnius prolixus]|uniref:RNase H type-1 domain-containing protein n=1 Tax=Rhodnius prolixus TaxID=13249 RepID=T1I1Z9_RHOPR